jgi:hypothetical protein
MESRMVTDLWKYVGGRNWAACYLSCPVYCVCV